MFLNSQLNTLLVQVELLLLFKQISLLGILLEMFNYQWIPNDSELIQPHSTLTSHGPLSAHLPTGQIEGIRTHAML